MDASPWESPAPPAEAGPSPRRPRPPRPRRAGAPPGPRSSPDSRTCSRGDARMPRRVIASDVTPLAADGGAVEADGLEQAQDHAEMFFAQVLGTVAGDGHLAATEDELLVARLARGGLRGGCTGEPPPQLHSGHRPAHILARGGPRARSRRHPDSY